MNFLQKHNRTLLSIVLTALLLGSCERFEGDVKVPAYIHLDRMDVVAQAHNAPSVEEGFYSSEVDAVYMVCYREGSRSWDTIGAFQLPCTVPLLYNGDVQKLEIYPIVKISGISGMRGYYSALQPITIEDLHLVSDSITNLGNYDATRQQWYLECNYKTKNMLNVLTEDYFEPTCFATNFDSNIVWVKDDRENACTGQGYGLIHVSDTMDVVRVNMIPEFNPDPTNALYLELDYKSDIQFWVHMRGFRISANGNVTAQSVLAIKPSDHWQKMYIMLGKTWSLFNYNVPISLYLEAANIDGHGGNVMIDNVKVISFPAI